MPEIQSSLSEGVVLILKADPSRGRDVDLEVTVQKVKDEKVLVEVIVWGHAAYTKWVRPSELEDVGLN